MGGNRWVYAMNSNMCLKGKRFWYLTTLVVVFLFFGLPLPGNGESVDFSPEEKESIKMHYTYIISHDTVYYLSGPQQSMPPEGKFTAGQRVRLLQDAGSYSLVESEDGITAYVSSDSFRRIDPQVVPVVLLLKSIKESDQALFQSVYSKKTKDDFAKDAEFNGDWEKFLKYYSKIIREGMFSSGGLGDYRLEDFELFYTGAATKGEVSLVYKGKDSGELSVINEGGVWKIDEK